MWRTKIGSGILEIKFLEMWFLPKNAKKNNISFPFLARITLIAK